MKSTLSDQILAFYAALRPDWQLPRGVELIFPFDDRVVKGLLETFYRKYFSDHLKRTFLVGINPGRLGAGMTGVPFTDPVILQDICDIPNDLPRKNELSSIFIYEMIEAMGGPDFFYNQFYITSACPLGFLKDGKNYNYYDSPELISAVRPHIIYHMEEQLQFPCHREEAFSIGQGKNYHFLKQLNDEQGWFGKITPLPHPRWVLQYKRRTKQTYLDEYLQKLSSDAS